MTTHVGRDEGTIEEAIGKPLWRGLPVNDFRDCSGRCKGDAVILPNSESRWAPKNSMGL